MSIGSPRLRPVVLVLAVAVALLLSGCRQDMHDNPRIEPYEANAFFDDGVGSRPLPAGTVARGFLKEDTRFWHGTDEAGQWIETFPMDVTREVILRGQERYEIFCAPCHDSVGTGNGMIVRRGFKQPSSYHEERLLEAPNGYIYDVATNGFGVMSGYAQMVPAADRWAIVAYIRVLQHSRSQQLGDLPPEMRTQLEADVAAADGVAPRRDGAGYGTRRPFESTEEEESSE